MCPRRFFCSPIDQMPSENLRENPFPFKIALIFNFQTVFVSNSKRTTAYCFALSNAHCIVLSTRICFRHPERSHRRKHIHDSILLRRPLVSDGHTFRDTSSHIRRSAFSLDIVVVHARRMYCSRIFDPLQGRFLSVGS